MIYLTIIGGIVLFLIGFYTGAWLARNSYRTVEVPKLIETQKVVEAEKPVVIQVPQPAKPNNGALAVMGSGQFNRSVVTKEEQRESEHMMDIINQLPEV